MPATGIRIKRRVKNQIADIWGQRVVRQTKKPNFVSATMVEKNRVGRSDFFFP